MADHHEGRNIHTVRSARPSRPISSVLASRVVADFATVTEVPGEGASGEQLSMLYSRYCYAVQYCAGRDVLEVACGAGMGLGYLAGHARRVVGGDVTTSLLARAQHTYRGRVPFIRLDAHRLPFASHSFDVVVLFESLYYLSDPAAFMRECQRILRPNGTLLLCTVNPEWAEFNPSPHSCWYFGATDLDRILREYGFTPRLYGAFPVAKHSARDRMTSWMKRMAVRFRLIPSTMKGKQWLKRLFLGPLIAVPAILHDGIAVYDVPVPVETGRSVRNFKIIFAVARLT